MKLGVIYEPEGANSYYRAIFPLQALQRRGHKVVWPAKANAVPMREYLSCDLVHCYRRMDRLADLHRLSSHGVAISFDNDDDFAASEMSLQGEGLRGHRNNQDLFRKVLAAAQLADLATAPSEPLAARYRSSGAGNVAVIENYVDGEMAGFCTRSKHDGVVLGWVAAREHQLDLARVPIVPALKRLLEVHPQLRLVTIGVRLPLHDEHYEHIPFVAFPELLRTLNRIDVGIAPLVDNAFNRSRSNVKLKEYASAGAAWLASPVGPYLGLGEEQGGMLVDDDGWYSALDQLIRRPRQRKRLAKRALRWAKSQKIQCFASSWEDGFQLAIEVAAQRNARRPFGVNVSRRPDYVHSSYRQRNV
jgi:hypothetical protein